MNDGPVHIQFVLVSHTNSGKTTLARTLLGLDIGEVRDAAHVTTMSESHTLLRSTCADTLSLWDTPGFGDSVRLLKRLGMSDNPLGWFLRELLDRYRDRSFWLSQQALRAARDSADVVLYLVNASEDPGDTGYLASEMGILEWLKKPVLVLLNQMGPPLPGPQAGREEERWRRHLKRYPMVRDVLALDAFARCWVHERVFYEAVAKLVDAPRSAGYARLLATWESNNQQRFADAMRLTSLLLVAAALDQQAFEPRKRSRIKSALQAVGLAEEDDEHRGKQAMNSLVERLDRNIGETTRQLLLLHKIEPGEAARINARVQKNFVVRAPVDKAQAGLLGAVISGAATGLTTDLVSGGLTMGAGALLGGVLGALTFAGAAWGFNSMTDRSQPSVRFTHEFMRELLASSILRYLTIAHFGRGRGNFEEGEAPAFWRQEVESAVAAEDDRLLHGWRTLPAETGLEGACDLLTPIVTRIATRTLGRLYPDAFRGKGPEWNATFPSG